MFEIKNRWTGAVLYRSETADTVRQAVEEAVKARADLRAANLRDADLRAANLRDADRILMSQRLYFFSEGV